jgi:hypothetical protein
LDYCLNKYGKICKGSTKPVLPGPGSQRGLGVGGSFVGTTILLDPGHTPSELSQRTVLKNPTYEEPAAVKLKVQATQVAL